MVVKSSIIPNMCEEKYRHILYRYTHKGDIAYNIFFDIKANNVFFVQTLNLLQLITYFLKLTSIVVQRVCPIVTRLFEFINKI